MGILATIKNIFALVAIMLLSSVGTAAHASAMSASAYKMGEMNHGVRDGSSCATLCRTAVLDKEEANVQREDKEAEDEPAAAFFVQPQVAIIDQKSVTYRIYAGIVKPPPRVPIYILQAVFRV